MRSATPRIYQLGELRLDTDERVVLRPDGSAVPLTPRVFATLRYLVEHSGSILDKEEIMEAVWPDSIVEENNLTQHISTLRRVLGDSAGAPRYIVTVPGRGYRFAAKVMPVEANGAEDAGAANGAPQQAVISSNGSADAAPQRSLPAVAAPQHPDAAIDRAAPVATISRRKLWLGGISALLLLAAAATVVSLLRQPGHSATNVAAPEKSIAVLPFANLSSDPQSSFFTEGITDEILTRVAKIGGLKVISRTSTLQFKAAAPRDLREIASRLGVANILEGSVQSSGDSVRVTVQLIDARTDTHLWAETFDRKTADMFQVESDIAQSVANLLQAKLTKAEQRAIRTAPTTNLEAYNACLRGRYFWNKRTLEGYRQAVGYFQTATELDPSYSQAYAGLADAYLFLAGESASGHEEALKRARAALQKALELNPDLAEAHATAGLLQENFDWDWDLAEKEYKRAIELQPNYATAHQWYGEFLAFLGRSEQAIAESKLACELDPLSLIINTDLGKVYVLTRHPDEAIAQLEKTLAMDPQFPVARAWLAQMYSIKGMPNRALQEIQGIDHWEENPSYLLWVMGVQLFDGDRAGAERRLQQLRDLAARTYVSPFWLASAYARLGYRDEAFSYLETAIDQHASSSAIALKSDTDFDSIRSDPRFQAILRRVHLAP